MPIICGEFLLLLKSQVEIFQNMFSEIVLSFEFIYLFIYFSLFAQVVTLYEQVFGSEQRSLNNEVELDERTWFIKANTNIWDLILDWVLLGH